MVSMCFSTNVTPTTMPAPSFLLSFLSNPSADSHQSLLPVLISSRAYTPSNPEEFFLSDQCTPGDYQGENTATQALASCVFMLPETDSVVSSL